MASCARPHTNLYFVLDPGFTKSVSGNIGVLMTKELVILIADDDAGHARLIEKNLQRAGLHNTILRFENGQDILDFLLRRRPGEVRINHTPYLLLLDIRMPKVDGVEVLRQVKADAQLRKLPVIMLTTTDDPREVGRCHELGCSNYLVKPVDYEKFSEAIKQLGLFVGLVQVPEINGQPAG
jgi:CheY-like chemotaxis protein